MATNTRIVVAETLGTAVLMIGGVGTAVLAGEAMGAAGIALAFGLSLLVMAAMIGHVSGCHINPAITIGMVLARKTSPAQLPAYLGGQFAGAVLGAFVVFVIASGLDGFSASEGFAANGWGELSPSGFTIGAVAVAEVAVTALFVLAVLATTRKGFPPALGPIAAGLALTLVHLVTIPVSNTSVNPARSLGAAVFQGGDALAQVWLFFLAPLVGAALAAGLWRTLERDVPIEQPVPAPLH